MEQYTHHTQHLSSNVTQTRLFLTDTPANSQNTNQQQLHTQQQHFSIVSQTSSNHHLVHPISTSPQSERPQVLLPIPGSQTTTGVVSYASSSVQDRDRSLMNSCSSPVPSVMSSANSTPTMMRQKVGIAGSNRVVVLNVNGERMTVDPAIFQNYPNTMLGRMFGPSLDHNLTKKNAKGEYEIKGSYVSEEVFRLIIDFYKFGYIRIPANLQVVEVKAACDYFLIPFNDETVRAANMAALLHELANEGAQSQFSQFVDNIIRPVVFQLARKGERECHVVVIMSEDMVDWDEEYPPPKVQPEVEASLIRDDHLCRFLKYVENRDVAKNVLKDMGLKKIKLGIEGFPTQMEKMKTTNRGRPEVVYNYIQRPFVHLSWEKEEARSRHVDFECRPVNMSTNLAEAASDTDIDQPQAAGHLMTEAESEQLQEQIHNAQHMHMNGSTDSSSSAGGASGAHGSTSMAIVPVNTNGLAHQLMGSQRLPPHLSLAVNTNGADSPHSQQHHSPPIVTQDQDLEDRERESNGGIPPED